MASEIVSPEMLPDVCPRLVVGEDDNLEELTRSEAVMIGFMRCLPDDLKAEFRKVFEAGNDTSFSERMAAFQAKAHPRRDEIVAAGWSWWA